jgi:hypothetical protein
MGLEDTGNFNRERALARAEEENDQALVRKEVAEFQRWARTNGSGRIYVKRWQKTTHSYAFGYVIVTNGDVEPVVYIPEEEGKPGRFRFDSITQLVSAGWIGD